MAQKKKIRAGKKSTRGAGLQRKRARPAKVMALAARDAVKRLPQKSPIVKKETSRAQNAPPSELPKSSGRQHQAEVAPVLVKAISAQSMYASQMQLFTTLLKWSPLSLFIRQQVLVNEMIFGTPSRSAAAK